MANATAAVPIGITPWGDSAIRRPLINTAQTWYPGIMVALDASGYLNFASDTAGLKFDGIFQREGSPVVVFSGEASGDHINTVERPWRFTAKIASAAAGDEGKKLYVVDNQTVGYTSSNAILVGFVDQVLSSTVVLVNPLYAPLNPVAVASNVLTFSGATGVDQIVIPDNLADALSVVQGTDFYLTFVTTNGSELTVVKGPAATGVTNTGGGIQLTAGIGGATSGAGGSIVSTGGAGTNGNSAGGLVSYTGGAGQGSAAGGVASLVGGAGGVTGAGGAAVVTGGAGGATSGTGGAFTATGGAGTNGNAVGGAASVTGGAGNGTGAGAVASLVGGASGAGATGNGGVSKVVGGAAASTNGSGGAAQLTGGLATGTGTGGAVTITSGDSGGAGGTAGTVTIDAGSAAGGTGGTVSIAPTNATGVSVGASITMADAKNIVFNTTTGTKIGTGATQKLAFYNATPVVQPATHALDVTGFVAGSGTASKSDSSWAGPSGSTAYGVGDIVGALKSIGLLAP